MTMNNSIINMTQLHQLFLLTLISMTQCLPIINICTRLAIRFRVIPFSSPSPIKHIVYLVFAYKTHKSTSVAPRPVGVNAGINFQSLACLICNGAAEPITKSSCVQALRNASLLRENELCDKLNSDSENFVCHRACVSTYCSQDHIQWAQERKRKAGVPMFVAETKRFRRNSDTFTFCEHCLFCRHICIVKRPTKNLKRWKEAYVCRTGDANAKQHQKRR